MMIFERDIAIDLGTTNIRVFVRGKGIMLREPSIVAVDKYTGRMLKVGQDAQKMLGRTPANIVAIHPISAGAISDYDMTALMLKELLSRVTSFSLFKPRVLVTVPSSVTGVEERNVIDAVIEAGARKHKQRNTQPQSGTGDAAKRRANIAGAYRMKRSADVTGKRVLLIDDIVTTGATLSECARVLGKAGAEQVVCATVARSAD